MASNQKPSAPADDDAAPRDPTEAPDHHVETAEEVYRRAADAAAPIPSAAQRAYGLSADAVYEAGTRMARHPWVTLAAGALIGCLAGVFLKSRR
jgi:ElaB/YqjD/DUF883 family membrane-anchored ribosome-binding protein